MFLRSSCLARQLKLAPEFRFITTFSYLQKESGEDDGGKQSDPNSKLNALLLSIAKEEKAPPSTIPKIQVPKPRAKHRLIKSEKISAPKKNLGTQIVDAAKTVATEIRGDTKEIEAQLLHRLLYKDSPVKQEVLKASSDNHSLANLLSKMTVEREEKVEPKTSIPDQGGSSYSRSAQVRNLLGKHRLKDQKIPRREQRVNLFGGEALNAFNVETCQNKGFPLKTWEACDERERKLSVTHPPSNYFEELIDWTEKGILWKFPIDNEYGMIEEKGVSFASHVLLESHLDDWCPTSGPIRHFMELVCVGLSRNHWLTAEEKEQHIIWYRDFFTEKRQLVKELGAGEIPEQHSPQQGSS